MLHAVATAQIRFELAEEKEEESNQLEVMSDTFIKISLNMQYVIKAYTFRTVNCQPIFMLSYWKFDFHFLSPRHK